MLGIHGKVKRRALVIGIGNYFNKLSSLTAWRDASRLGSLLKNHGSFDVKIFCNSDDHAYNDNVSKSFIRKQIEEWFLPPNDLDPPDTALFYFAGHGLNKGLVFSDNQVNDNQVFEYKLLWNILQKRAVKETIIWLDCCYSGAFLDIVKSDKKPVLDKNYFIITACSSNEKAYQSDNQQPGKLTEKLLEWLNPENLNSSKICNTDLIDKLEKINFENQHPCWYPKNQANTRSITLTAKLNQYKNDKCPYKGLNFFNENDSDFFYGRSKLINEFINLLDGNSEFKCLVIAGASGSGKSSLIRAGLLHELKDGKCKGSHIWNYYNVFTPGNAPLANLEKALGSASEQIISTIQQANERTVILIDQFEECFTHCKDIDESLTFFEKILQIIQFTGKKLCLIIGIRADFLGIWSEYGGLFKEIEKYLHILSKMDDDELCDVIVKPANKISWKVEPQLIDYLISEVKKLPGSLPLLQFILEKLWYECKKKPPHNELDWHTYKDIGGIYKALENHANEIYDSFQDDKEKAIIRRIFLGLIYLGEGIEGTRKRVAKKSLFEEHDKELVGDVINKLVEARLIVTDKDEQNEEILDVIHEALIRHWTALKQWIDIYQDDIRFKNNLEAQATRWEESGCRIEPAFLLQGYKLEEAENFKEKCDRDKYDELMINDTVRKFIDCSTLFTQVCDLSERAFNLADSQPVEASIQAIEAICHNVILNEKLNSAEDIILPQSLDSLLITINAICERKRFSHTSRILDIAVSPNGEWLVTAGFDGKLQLWDIINGSQIQHASFGHERAAYSLTISADGQMIVSGSDDGTVMLWNILGKILIDKPLKGNQGRVYAVAISPDGETIVSGGSNGCLCLWDKSGTLTYRVPEYTKGAINSITITTSGQWIVTSGDDDNAGVVRRWNRQENFCEEMLRLEGQEVTCVAVSSDETQIVIGSSDGCLRLLELKTKQQREIYVANQVNAVAFSHSSKWIAAAGDATVILWEPEKNRRIYLRGHQKTVNSVKFSSNEKFVISGSDDGTVRLWAMEETHSGKVFSPLTANEEIRCVMFVSNQRIISASKKENDGVIIRAWDLEGNYTLLVEDSKQLVCAVAINPEQQRLIISSRSISGYNLYRWNLNPNPVRQLFLESVKNISAVAINNNGEQIVSAYLEDGYYVLQLWDWQGNRIGQRMKGHERKISCAAFSPDGKWLVSGSDDGSLRLWNLENKTNTDVIEKAHPEAITCIAFSPDGKWLVSGSDDRTLRLWNLENRANAPQKPIIIEEAHKKAITCIAFSPSGKWIVSGSEDTTLRLWNWQGKPIGQPLLGHSHHVTSVAFSPDGKRIISGSKDGKLRLWTECDWQTCLKDAHNLISEHSLWQQHLKESIVVQKVLSKLVNNKQNFFLS